MANELRNVRLGELSLVKRGANKGARTVLIKTGDRDYGDAAYVTLLKRDFTAEERRAAADAGEAMSDGSYPIKTVADLENAIQSVGRADNPDAVKTHIKRRAKALGATDKIPDTWSKSADPLAKALLAVAKQEEDGGALSTFADELAELEGCQEVCTLLNVLQQNLFEIMSDDDAVAADKVAAMGVSVGQFLSTLRDRFPDAETQLTKLLKQNEATAAFFTEAPHGKDTPMTEAEKQQLADLTKKVDDMTKVNGDLKKELAKASMSDEHKAYMAQMPEEKRGDFSNLDAAGRDAFMTKNPVKKSTDKDESFTIGTNAIKKSDVGEGVFNVIKALHETTVSQAAQLAKAEDNRTETELVAKARTDYPNVPGEPLDKARVLKALDKVDPKVRETVEKIMAFANKAASDRLSELGGGGEIEIGTAEQELNKLAKAHATEHKVDFAKAYDHVLTSNPALYQKYLQEKRKQAQAA